MRMFVVIVQSGSRWLKYPPMDGEHALRLMKTMKTRGVNALAITEANGITEELSVEDMQGLFT